MEEFAQIITRQSGNEISSGGEHHVIVLELGPRLRGQRQMTKLAHRLTRVITYGEVVSGVACAMA